MSFTYTVPAIGNEHTVTASFPGVNIFATVHTHGAFRFFHLTDEFSQQDEFTNRRFGGDGYLVTPTGKLKHQHIDPLTDRITERILADDLPSDPNAPDWSNPSGVGSDPTTTTYEIQEGDSLSDIATRFETTPERIMEENWDVILDDDYVSAGDYLQITN